MTFQIKDLGMQDYAEIYNAMREFNDQRDSNSEDQIWLLEHPPVYTLGLDRKNGTPFKYSWYTCNKN